MIATWLLIVFNLALLLWRSAIIYGRLRALEMNTGTHWHTCPDCGHAWEHGDEMKGDDDAHTCEKCGKKVFWRSQPKRPDDGPDDQ